MLESTKKVIGFERVITLATLVAIFFGEILFENSGFKEMWLYGFIIFSLLWTYYFINNQRSI